MFLSNRSLRHLYFW